MEVLGFETYLFITVISVYFLSFVFYFVYLISPETLYKGRIASVLLLIGAVFHTALIIVRIIETKHLPFQTLYEALSWFSYSVVIAYLIVEWKGKVKLPGIIITAVAISASLYAIFGLSPHVRLLPPALQSKWFFWHVVTALSSYGPFTVAFSVEVVFLILGKGGERYGLDEKAKKLFHRMAYSLVLFGFPFLAFGIISGAAWAQEAWGGYWVWDPKETWSLITWLVYTIYLHSKVTPGWVGKRSSVLNILGFVCVIFTFLGVNWLSRLLHIPSLHAF